MTKTKSILKISLISVLIAVNIFLAAYFASADKPAIVMPKNLSAYLRMLEKKHNFSATITCEVPLMGKLEYYVKRDGNILMRKTPLEHCYYDYKRQIKKKAGEKMKAFKGEAPYGFINSFGMNGALDIEKLHGIKTVINSSGAVIDVVVPALGHQIELLIRIYDVNKTKVQPI